MLGHLSFLLGLDLPEADLWPANSPQFNFRTRQPPRQLDACTVRRKLHVFKSPIRDGFERRSCLIVLASLR